MREIIINHRNYFVLFHLIRVCLTSYRQPRYQKALLDLIPFTPDIEKPMFQHIAKVLINHQRFENTNKDFKRFISKSLFSQDAIKSNTYLCSFDLRIPIK